MTTDLPKAYDPHVVEREVTRRWEKQQYGNPDNLPKRHRDPFVVMMALPNVTGSLHLGHALEASLIDCLVRWKRMQGFRALYLPGTDHAGIATQNVVEKELKKEGLSRHSLGREKFLERVWQWKERYGGIIMDRFRRLGVSVDWSRERFTMDAAYAKGVETAFRHYHEKGWIYRGERVTNWCSRCQTSLSDLELEYREEKSKLWYLRYPLAKSNEVLRRTWGDHDFVVVATTRPETMLGDTAVAVHPDDERYRSLVGASVRLPLTERDIPIIADAAVDRGFGTGAVKVTPAHDLMDAEIGERHGLSTIAVIGKDDRMTDAAPEPYRGMKITDARAAVPADLKALGLLGKTEDYVHNVAMCYRCGSVVEPLPSEQWFLKMRGLAGLAADAYRDGRVRILPEKWLRVALDRLAHERDWCISRQIWWGHRIPVWYCGGPDRARLRMGFHERTTASIENGEKTKTYRLSDHATRHDIHIGDEVPFENSQTKRLFGYGTITHMEQVPVRKIRLDDPAHGATYQTVDDLIAAFQFHHPDHQISPETLIVVYTYDFAPVNEHASRGCGNTVVAHQPPARCPECSGVDFVRDPDVLDTWFSSALWPFATLGWPHETKDLATYYPTTWMTSARDILFLWINRMVFSGIELAGDVPFREVFIHPTVLTKDGKRMSKSLGTGVDPLVLIERYGADAVRFGLLWQLTGIQDIRFDESAIVAGKKFLNKLWNACRYTLARTEERAAPRRKPEPTHENDRAILEAFDAAVAALDRELEALRFGQALAAFYEFFWHAFCDRYLETTKAREDDSAKDTLLWVLGGSLRALHPFIPFITDALWETLPHEEPIPLMIADWPKTDNEE